ncbi:MAG: helix-turn-helix domain-containing protein [Parcubacteria group bacterium]
MIAANEQSYPFVHELQSCDASQLRQVIAHAAGLLAHRSSPTQTRSVLGNIAVAIWDRPTLKQLAAEFCAYEGTTIEELCGPQRSRICARPRQHFMYLAVEKHGKSLSAVGRFLNRDHTTIMHGVEAYKKRAGL